MTDGFDEKGVCIECYSTRPEPHGKDCPNNPVVKAKREAAIERQQIEQVFGLTGGELADEPWMHWVVEADIKSAHVEAPEYSASLYPFTYWYDGVPEYVERELTGGDAFWRTHRTAIAWGGGFMSAPDPEIYDGDGVWKLVASYNNSGEVPCPNRDYDPIVRSEVTNAPGHTREVTPEEAAVSVEGDRCPLCEEKLGDEHGYIYIGEGYEAVYVLEEQRRDGRAIEQIAEGEKLSDSDVLMLVLDTIDDIGRLDEVTAAVWQKILAKREERED